MKARVKKIYSHSLQILEEVGIILKHKGILNLLKENNVKIENETAFFTKDQVEYWIKKAPESFTLHAKNPSFSAVIGKDHVNYSSGYGCPTIYELDGRSRNAVLSDYIKFAKLIHQCGHFSINGGILAQPSDVPAELSHLVMVYSALKTSDKCLMGVPGNEAKVTQIMDMCAILFGGKDALRKTPRILTLVNTISPLLIDETALATIKVAADFNQPIIISPAPTAGTTGPIDLAGNMALATAEALAGTVIAQILKPGVPVVFGALCNIANLQTGNISTGSPGFALQSKYTAAIARMLKMPSRCGGAVTDSLSISPQSGYESMLSMLTASQNRVNLIIHSAGILNNFAAMSYEKFIIDLEIMDMVKYYLNDFEVNDSTLNMDLLKEVGPGGQFLTSMDTMKKCRSHSWTPWIGVRGNVRLEKAFDKYYANIVDKLKLMLTSYEPPQIDPDTEILLDEFMIQQGVSKAILSLVNNLLTQNQEKK